MWDFLLWLDVISLFHVSNIMNACVILLYEHNVEYNIISAHLFQIVER